MLYYLVFTIFISKCIYLFFILGVIDYNFNVLRDGMRKLFKLKENESS